MDFEIWAGLIALFALVLLGVPVVFAFACAAFAGLYCVWLNRPVMSLIQQTAISEFAITTSLLFHSLP